MKSLKFSCLVVTKRTVMTDWLIIWEVWVKLRTQIQDYRVVNAILESGETL